MKTLLLLGDSLIEWGDWDTLLPGYRTINRGSAGETVGSLAARLGYELEQVGDPDLIVLFSGTNDLLMGDYSFPAVFDTMLPRLRLLCPKTEVIVVGLAPMNMVLHEVEQVNMLLKKKARRAGCIFLDLVPSFQLHCRPVGNPCFLIDGVHFSPHGYRVLAGAIDNMLKTAT